MATARPKDASSARWVRGQNGVSEATGADVLAPGRAERRASEAWDVRAPRPGVWEVLKSPTPKSIIVSVLLAILAAGGAAVIVMKRPEVYSARATLLIDQPNAVLKAE